jgi:hypothetical protein
MNYTTIVHYFYHQYHLVEEGQHGRAQFQGHAHADGDDMDLRTI